jgi:mannose/fructose/N-acetylgalactosamine-specific phosphotransferase system component IIC
MILVLLIAGGALALAVLGCVAIDAPIPIGDAAAALVGVPFSSLDPEQRRE